MNCEGNEKPYRSERTRGSKTPPEEPGAGTASGRTGWTVLKIGITQYAGSGITLPACIVRGLKTVCKEGLCPDVLPETAPK